MSADFVVRYSDWKGGDAGVRDPAMYDSDQFSAENVSIYESGLVGPRAGMKVMPSDIPAHTTIGGPMGFTAWNNTLLIVNNNRVYQLPEAGGTATAWAPYGVTVDTPVRFAVGNRIVYSLTNGVLYKHDAAISTTVVDTPAPLSDFVRWNYWFVGVDRNRPWRLWFSIDEDKNPNFDVWWENGYIDVGDSDPITTLEPMYNTLYIGKREGWFAISGSPGIFSAVRDVVIGNGPISSKYSTVTTDNRVIYWPVDHVPAFFNGERVTLVDQQEMTPRFLPFNSDVVIVTPTARRLVLAGDDAAGGTKLLSYKAQAWTRQRANVRLGALAPTDVRQGSDLPKNVVYGVNRSETFGDPLVVFALTHELSRPAHVDDPYASPTDPGESALITGHLSTAAWYDGSARQVRVRWVVVQFRKWASGVPNSSNRLTLRVEALGGYSAGSETSEPVRWIEPSVNASRSGTDESWRVNVGEQGWANGFRLHFDEIAGVALREVIVGVNLRTERT